jgi:hypothetical protein
MQLITDPVARFIDLRAVKEKLEERLASVHAELASLESEILDAWAVEGKNRERRGDATIYFDRRLRVSVPDRKQSMAAALCEHLGWDECVRRTKWVDEGRLAARVRARMGDDLDESKTPQELKRAASIFVQTGLRLRRLD